ncbi:hypothetical protein ES705_27466 [subsurface metagenome]
MFKTKDGSLEKKTIEREKLVNYLKETVNSPKTPEEKIRDLRDWLESIKESYKGSEICKWFEEFIIYSPENSQIRNFQKEGQIEPLGRKGEGLFKLIGSFFVDDNKEKIDELKNNLKLFDWFSDFNFPMDFFEGEYSLFFKDKYVSAEANSFDQRNVNEGFLFLLFYFSLILSEKTPCFFAIENIETALNPKLCSKLIKNIVDLTKTKKKQVIITTHNPAVLDGLNLDDEQQRLFVIYRNKLGHSKAKRQLKPKPIGDEEPVRLSEAFLRGYLGGLPNNF